MAQLAEHLNNVEAREQDWYVFIENREAVLAALQEGRCDGILPAARSFLDGFAEFCLRAGVLKVFEAFPDHRARRSIPMFFFCNTLVHRPLWHLPRLQPIQDTLFRSPYILRQLGFNARQIDAGFYTTAAGAKPFTAEAIADAFVRARPRLPGEPASSAGKPVGLSGTGPSRGCGRWTACTSGCRAGAHAGTGLQSVCAGRVAGQRGLAHAVDAGGAKRSRDHGGAEAGSGSGSGHRGR